MTTRANGTLRYRVRQFLRAVVARVSEEELGQITDILTAASLDLFRSMDVKDQRHGLDVYNTLRRSGQNNPDLLAAALLHDVGKSAAWLSVWQRALIVLLERLAPGMLARVSQSARQPISEPAGPGHGPEGIREWGDRGVWGREGMRAWIRPFAVHAWHPEIGARWAENAGCSPLTVTLIRRHKDRPVNDQVAGVYASLNLPPGEEGNTETRPTYTEEDRLLAALQAADDLN
jgi:hypothetical protein